MVSLALLLLLVNLLFLLFKSLGFCLFVLLSMLLKFGLH